MSITTKYMKTDKLRIQILMSTYNAEKYLRPQLDSILNQQTDMEISILARDDGSTDGTAGILYEYAEKYGIDVHIGENLGTTRSYYELVNMRDKKCDFYALSDHDDVWLPEKLQTACAVIFKSGFNLTRPILFASRSVITDEHLKPIGMTRATPKGASFYNAMIQNIAAGHTQVLNNVLMGIIADSYSSDISVVDWWIYLIASAIGVVIFYNKPLVLYRQHNDNQLGYKANAVAMFLRRFRRLINEGGDGLTGQLRALKVLDYDIPESYREEVERFLTHQVNFISRIKYAMTAKAYRQKKWETMVFKILYIIGIYNVGGKNG